MGRYGKAYTISNVILSMYVTVFCIMNRNELKQCWQGDCRNFGAAKLLDMGQRETIAGPTLEPSTSLPPAIEAEIDYQPLVENFEIWSPKFIITGVMKCGTGAAHTFLGEHPNAIPASGEAYFFNKDKFYTQGFTYYRKYFLRRYRDKLEPFIHYEKSPTYYRSLTAPPRMRHMNETLKIVNVVCDNVKRTLSRYLHIKTHTDDGHFVHNHLSLIGTTLESFQVNLRNTIKVFGAFLEDVKNNEGDGTMDGLIKALTYRFKYKMRPFGIRATPDKIELILSDGFYAVFHQYWQQFFPDDQLLVVDGGQFLKTPWEPMIEIQKHVGLSETINESSFVFRDGMDVPCFIDAQKNVNCLGGDKGRSLHKTLDLDVIRALHELYRPFDNYFSQKVLKRASWQWNYGLEDL
ncbi:unnamed protein product [Oikopleura dioica]|uniref:Sulfotransferase n=1 Tax=Oikopleura dioica TaxID=34765 RepID=E4XAN2_OIKDI|nr:unnamed protein product [Oikopleura dioica]